jgi:SAM-dependent methyltransferase
MGEFTAHNIQFPDGSVSMSGHPTLLADEPRCRATMRLLHMLYGNRLSGRRIADLGCLEGGYAVEFARAGMDSIGIEVRSSNFANCVDVQKRVGLPNLTFKQDNAWNLAKYGPYDVVYCCGLLYHLDRPREFIGLLGKVANDAIIINTHFAPWTEEERRFGLGSLTHHEGLPGRWFEDHGQVSETELDKIKWASWENQRSFWPVREGLVQAINDAGFDLILEQWDAASEGSQLFAVTTSDDYKSFLRSVFVGIRSASRPASMGETA